MPLPVPCSEERCIAGSLCELLFGAASFGGGVG